MAPVVGAAVGIGAWYASIGVVGQLLVQVAITAAVYGLSYLLSQAGARTQQAAGEQPGVSIQERDGLLNARRVYGRRVVAGGVFFQKTVADTGAAGPNIYVIGLALSQGVCDGLEAVIINGVECPVDGSGLPLAAPWVDGPTTRFKVSFRPGTDSQAIDPIIAARFPDEDVEFRQRGICTVVMEMHFGADTDEHTELWGAGGIPQLAFRIRGVLVFDPRNAGHDIDDPTTWAWSQNAALIEADWLRHSMGFSISDDEMDWASVSASAGIDDEWVPTLDAPERRGTINAEVMSQETNMDVLTAMAQQNRAAIGRTLGSYFIRSDTMAEPVATLHTGLVVGDIVYSNEPDTRSAINAAPVQFAPARRFNQSAETEYADAALIAADGQRFEVRLTLRYCDSPATAQRLAYAILTENREGRTLSLQLDLSAMVAAGKGNGLLEAGDVVRVDLAAPYDGVNGLYKVNSLELGGDFRVALQLVGTSTDVIGGWSPALEVPFETTALDAEAA